MTLLQPNLVYNTVQLYCLCVEKSAFWLVINIKYSVHFIIRYQQFSKTELKTAQLQKQYI